MGTHNLLLRLGDDIFLEVIAVNPDAEKPDRPLWFGLDSVTEKTPATLKSWVVRTTEIKEKCNDSSEFLGDIEPMRRGDLHWLMTIPGSEVLPLHQGAPMLIQWEATSHPASTLADQGLSLLELQIHSPDSNRIKTLIRSIDLKGNVKVVDSRDPKIIAWIDTPDGVRKIGD